MLKPVVPAQNTTMPPRLTTIDDTRNVCSPGCSNTMSTSRFPVMSQIALPKRRASLLHSLYSAEFTCGSWPQHLNFLRLIRSEEHTSELQSLRHLVCRLL